MSDLATEQHDSSANRLSAGEIIREIKALRDSEKIAIVKMARLYARKTPYGYEDLLQEAYSRALDGRRAWSMGVPAVLFFGGVIRSLVGMENLTVRAVSMHRMLDSSAAQMCRRLRHCRRRPP
jgi:hypothetical protein